MAVDLIGSSEALPSIGGSNSFNWLQDPTTAGAIAGLGAGVSAGGAFNTATAQQSMYNYQAALAANHAQTLTYMAADAEQRGVTNVQNVELQTAALKGSQRASMAANGIDMGQSGTAADILTTTDYMGARDAITAQHNADMEAWADTTNATEATNNSNLYKASSNSISPFMSLGTSLLTSATSFAKNNYATTQANGG